MLEMRLCGSVACHEVAESLKHWDKKELEVTFKGWPYDKAILYSLGASDVAFSVVIPSEPFDINVAVGGVGGDFDDACIWLLTTPEIEKYPKRVMELSRKFLNEIKALGYTKVHNYIHERNRTSIRWLKRLGFKKVNHRIKKHMIRMELDLWSR